MMNTQKTQKTHFSINKHSVHLWRIILSDFFGEVEEFFSYLSPDEIIRSERYKFVLHQKRFTVARGLLRRVLSLYTSISPAEIVFDYGEQGKPFLRISTLQFNISHSDDMAVFSISNEEIGIDIEKKSDAVNDGVAKRFFSKEENEKLSILNSQERINFFYQCWAEKEAIIKFFGKGIFSLDHHKKKPQTQVVFIHPEYELVIATKDKIECLEFFEWKNKDPYKIKDFTC